MKLATALIAALGLFSASCATGESPAILSVEVDGWAQVRSDLEHVVILGEGSGSASARAAGSMLPLWATQFVVQEGDYILIDEGESHHKAYRFPLPLKSARLFTPAELAELAARGIVLTFAAE